MRRLALYIKTGLDGPLGGLMFYREVRDEHLKHEYAALKTMPNVVSVIPQQKVGESWPEFVRITNALED